AAHHALQMRHAAMANPDLVAPPQLARCQHQPEQDGHVERGIEAHDCDCGLIHRSGSSYLLGCVGMPAGKVNALVAAPALTSKMPHLSFSTAAMIGRRAFSFWMNCDFMPLKRNRAT